MTLPSTILPALILTPHSSGFAPMEVLTEMLGDQVFDAAARQTRLEWLFAEGDPWTDLLFAEPDATSVHALTSRFVVDVNRERDEGGDNGVIKLTDFEGRPLYPDAFRLSDRSRANRLSRYWDGFNRDVERALETRALDGNPVKLIVDGHSMQPQGPAIGPDRGRPRPALTLMTGGDGNGDPPAGKHSSISPSQAQRVIGLLENHFGDTIKASDRVPHEVALNSPWSADNISQRFSHPDRPKPVPAFGLEFNRALYLEPARSGRPLEAEINTLNRIFRAFLRDALELF